MTNPTPLSPATKAVLRAANTNPKDEHAGLPQRQAIAAALRATADRANPKAHIEDINYVHESYVDGWKDALDVILSIADELDGANTSTGDFDD